MLFVQGYQVCVLGVIRSGYRFFTGYSITVKMREYSQEEKCAFLEARHVPIIKFGTTEQAVVMLLEEMTNEAATGNTELVDGNSNVWEIFTEGKRNG
jgi:hypothetical protein